MIFLKMCCLPFEFFVFLSCCLLSASTDQIQGAEHDVFAARGVPVKLVCSVDRSSCVKNLYWCKMTNDEGKWERIQNNETITRTPVNASENKVTLSIDKISEPDEGVYKCLPDPTCIDKPEWEQFNVQLKSAGGYLEYEEYPNDDDSEDNVMPSTGEDYGDQVNDMDGSGDNPPDDENDEYHDDEEEQPHDMLEPTGNSISLTCVVISSTIKPSRMNIYWTIEYENRGTDPIDETNPMFKQTEEHHGDEHKSVLTIIDLQKSNHTQYRCHMMSLTPHIVYSWHTVEVPSVGPKVNQSVYIDMSTMSHYQPTLEGNSVHFICEVNLGKMEKSKRSHLTVELYDSNGTEKKMSETMPTRENGLFRKEVTIERRSLLNGSRVYCLYEADTIFFEYSVEIPTELMENNSVGSLQYSA